MAKKFFDVRLDDKALNKQLSRAMKATPEKATKALTACVLDLAGEAIRRAPVESGDLRSMGHGAVNNVAVIHGIKEAKSVGHSEKTGAVPPIKSRSVGEVGFSGPYALRQHEDLALSHDRTDGYKRSDGTTVNMVKGGEAKFLEKPFNERKDKYIKKFEKVVADSIK